MFVNHNFPPVAKAQLDNAKRGIPSQGGGAKLTLTYDLVTKNQ